MTDTISNPPTFEPSTPQPRDLGDDAVALVEKWLSAPVSEHQKKESKSALLLAEVLKDQQGLDFTIGFVDRVVRPEDLGVAAQNLHALASQAPTFLPWYFKAGVRFGGTLAPTLPWLVVPIARRILRGLVGHLIVDARPTQLGKALARLSADNTRLNINLLGEAVLGQKEADARLAGTKALLDRDDVDYVSIKVSSVVPSINMWAFEESVATITDRLLPLYLDAARASSTKFINLDMEEYHDLDLTVAVFKRLLSRPDLKNFRAGIVLQAYLPDATAVLQDLTAWALQRVEDGGAPIKVRLVKGANLAMERVDAAMHDWALATEPSKQESDTNYKRALDWALRPEHTRAVQLGVAGHNLFDIAFAHLLAEGRGVSDDIEFEMLLGMAEEQAEAVRADVGDLLLYTPVVRPEQFDVAISYLIRRLEENASSENFMSAVFELTKNRALFDRERERFLASLNGVDTVVPAKNRSLDPQRIPLSSQGTFHNASDSDPSLPNIRQWGADILSRVGTSTLGDEVVAENQYTTEGQVDEAIQRALEAAPSWAALGGSGRAAVLRECAAELSRRRASLIEVAASETGKVIAEGDVEISEAVDFANFYALGAEELDAVSGAEFVPSKLTVVTPPWNFPIAITAGSILAPLGAGSAVIVKPAPQAKRCAAEVVSALWAAGVPKDVLIYADAAEGPIGQHLIAHPSVDRVILTGAYETAQLFRSWRPELPLLAETSGKNAIIVTPSADPDLAAKDVVRSAFGHAGQKCSAASLAILVGNVAKSDRFKNQLIDAASSLKVGLPEAATTEMGPLVESARGKLKTALTQLGDGEEWLVEPKQLDEEGRLFSPGVRTNVKPGSYFHLTEFFGPVLGIMHARTLEEAIEMQNAVDFGLTAGLHTLDSAELAQWLDRVEAGNVYVNRSITGAIVRRQPFGGWKRSSVGAGAKAGGSNYLVHLGSWRDAALPSEHEGEHLQAAVEQALQAVEPLLEDEQKVWLRRAVADDARLWAEEFGINKDVSSVGVERNVFRYLPVPVCEIRDVGGAAEHLVRSAAAGYRAGAVVTVSLPPGVSTQVHTALKAVGARVLEEPMAQWCERLASMGAVRVRLIGDDGGAARTALAQATQGSPEVAVYAGPMVSSGRIEMLPFLREQAVAITAHRFGNPDNISHTVLPEGEPRER